jgi:hypothetical protein
MPASLKIPVSLPVLDEYDAPATRSSGATNDAFTLIPSACGLWATPHSEARRATDDGSAHRQHSPRFEPG